MMSCSHVQGGDGQEDRGREEAYRGTTRVRILPEDPGTPKPPITLLIRAWEEKNTAPLIGSSNIVTDPIIGPGVEAKIIETPTAII
jgi:hypothetical protein